MDRDRDREESRIRDDELEQKSSKHRVEISGAYLEPVAVVVSETPKTLILWASCAKCVHWLQLQSRCGFDDSLNLNIAVSRTVADPDLTLLVFGAWTILCYLYNLPGLTKPYPRNKALQLFLYIDSKLGKIPNLIRILTLQLLLRQTSDPKSCFATVEKDLPGGLTPMLGDWKGIIRKGWGSEALGYNADLTTIATIPLQLLQPPLQPLLAPTRRHAQPPSYDTFSLKIENALRAQEINNQRWWDEARQWWLASNDGLWPTMMPRGAAMEALLETLFFAVQQKIG
ncbi:hypothetical protein RIF29_29484 [Crotalaria pallida]|uniref:Uncharacterized protein n=1 Tax=Crotalaria pallida TaxID=3830 RepID=A0AAN9EGZ8_CROPI